MEEGIMNTVSHYEKLGEVPFKAEHQGHTLVVAYCAACNSYYYCCIECSVSEECDCGNI